MENNNKVICFERINSETVRSVYRLSFSLSEKQRQCVEDNSLSIAQAHFSENAWFRAIYLGDELIGFIMLHYGSDKDDGVDYPGVYLWRFMIAKPYQSKGYGKKAIELLLKNLKLRGFSELQTSCIPLSINEESPEQFFKKLGFKQDNKTIDNEIVLTLNF